MSRDRRTTTRRTLAALSAVALALACGDDAGPTEPPDDGNGGGDDMQLAAQEVASGLSSPVHLAAPQGDDRLFVVEQPGTIRIVRDGTVESEPFLDIRSAVASGGERGLLSVAFHPDFDQNGRLYVNFTLDGQGDDEGATRVVRYEVGADPDRADPATADTLLKVQQPFSNHNGGLLAFGPDGMLYVGLGDGGDAGDPFDHGQDSTTVLGSLLRLDVDGGDPFAVPGDNPFVGRQGSDLIWAYGLRNPWRFTFDPVSGTLLVADVGQNELEEVNAVDASAGGINYGWNTMEGTACFEPSSGCDTDGLTLPVLEYDHGEGCSITGGHVYRGDDLPDLRGQYFFSDFCSGFLRSFPVSGDPSDVTEWDVGDLGQVTSFGVGGQGELYIVTQGGTVLRLAPGG